LAPLAYPLGLAALIRPAPGVSNMLRFALIFAAVAGALALLLPAALPELGQHAAPALAAPASPEQQPAKAAPTPTPAAVNFQTPGALTSPGGYGVAAIAADANGQFASEVMLNGVAVRMLVDTGATMLALSYETASRIGVSVFPHDYKVAIQTANGRSLAAPVTLREVRVGAVVLTNVEALVLDRDAGPANLLGMSFLKRLAKVEQAGGKLVLRQ